MSAAAGVLRRNRGVVVVVALVLALLVVLTVLGSRSAGSTADLDPANASANGAQAVARVLAQHGVQVDVVRRAAGLERATLDRDTTLLVTSTDSLGRATARGVGLAGAAAGGLVLADPSATLIAALHLPVVLDDARVGRTTPAACSDTLLGGLTVAVGPSPGYRGRGPTVQTCFRGRGGRAAWLVARVDGVTPTYAVAGAGLFTNHRVARADNAAVALRLLGQHARLVWYVPDPRDVATGDTGSVAAQLPGGLFPALWLVAAAALATMLWRGRRLGPLVVEPLPVVVKAVESTQGRGRLYRRVRDHGHAAGTLRAATGRRLASRLRLPATTGPDGVAAAVAAATGADPRAVLDLLVHRPVTDDDSLNRLAGDLATLEREVHDA